MNHNSGLEPDGVRQDNWQGLTRRTTLVSAIILALTGLLSAVAFVGLPEAIVVHWGLFGQPNLTIPSSIGLSVFPAMGVLIFAVFAIAPHVDPLGGQIEEFRSTYELLLIVLLLINGLTSIFVVAWNAGLLSVTEQPIVLRLTAVFAGALLFASSWVLKNVEPNNVVGVRTKWTLNDDRVWERTHDRAVPLFRITGIVTALGAVVPSVSFAAVLLIAPLLMTTAYLIYYSYREFHEPTYR